MSGNLLLTTIARLESELTKARQEAAHFAQLYGRVEATQFVEQLDQQGVIIPDKAVEIDRLSKMTQAERYARVQDISLNYARDPNRIQLNTDSVRPVVSSFGTNPLQFNPHSGSFNEPAFEQSLDYVRKNPNSSFDEAVAKTTR